MTGPYIVTTKRPASIAEALGDPTAWIVLSRRAVATLDEARDQVKTEIDAHGGASDDWWRDSLPESGGTVGPLPDGTVIEVEATTWVVLAAEVGITLDPRSQLPVRWREILDTYNARQK